MNADTVTIKPSGHHARPSQRYTEVDASTLRLCVSWLDNCEEATVDDTYWHAMRFITDNPIDAQQALNLPIHPYIEGHRSYMRMGAFMSAIYNKFHRQTIIYPHNTPRISAIGYEYWGLFVNAGTLGDSVSMNAHGPIINAGTAGALYGDNSPHVIINLGNAGARCGFMARQVIDAGKSKSWGGGENHLDIIIPTAGVERTIADCLQNQYLHFFSISPELEQYLAQLKEDLANPATFCSKYNKDNVESTIERLLGGQNG
jgi:hypothetical protein